MQTDTQLPYAKREEKFAHIIVASALRWCAHDRPRQPPGALRARVRMRKVPQPSDARSSPRRKPMPGCPGKVLSPRHPREAGTSQLCQSKGWRLVSRRWIHYHDIRAGFCKEIRGSIGCTAATITRRRAGKSYSYPVRTLVDSWQSSSNHSREQSDAW